MSRIGSDLRQLGLALAPAGLVAGVAWLTASSPGSTPSDVAWAAGLAALAGGGWAVTVWIVQSQRIARLTEAARRLVSGGLAGVPDWRGLPAGGAMADLAASLRDLGQRISAQVKEVAKKTRNLEALIDALDEPVLATDSRDLVLLCNRAAESLFDAPPGGLLGRPIRELFTRPALLEMHAEARAGRASRRRVPMTTADGIRTFQVSAAPVPVAWGEGIYGAVLVLRDVTELAQAVQVKTDFVANASHELRTPISAIKAAVETLGDAARDDPVYAERLRGIIANHLERLEALVSDLMDLSRLESPEVPVTLETVDVRAAVGPLCALFDGACRERGLTLDVHVDDAVSVVRTDRRLFQLVLNNLVDNATKFAYEGTPIRIRVRPVERAESLPGPGAPRWLRVEVADRGVGIPLSQQERVFERFYQVDAARTGVTTRRGTGLGLAIVKHAVKALGGQVGLESVWKEGTTVWADIPTDAPAAARAAG